MRHRVLAVGFVLGCALSGCEDTEDQSTGSGNVDQPTGGDGSAGLADSAETVDESSATECFDRDTDGYVAGQDCAVAPETLDCNDNPEAGGTLVHPGRPEECDGIDNNCNTLIDEGCP